MRAKTLLEKRYGPGIREGLMLTYIQPSNTCAAEVKIGGHACREQPHGPIELYVDEAPPGRGWYPKLLRRLSAALPHNSWARMIFCQRHLAEVVELSEDYASSPDLWSPVEYCPPVLTRPPLLIATSAGN